VVFTGYRTFSCTPPSYSNRCDSIPGPSGFEAEVFIGWMPFPLPHQHSIKACSIHYAHMAAVDNSFIFCPSLLVLCSSFHNKWETSERIIFFQNFVNV